MGVAQTSNKKKVLVIPYSRFEFVSEFDIAEIAEKNETTEANVFNLYQKTLLNTFEQHADENFAFIQAQHELIQPYTKYIKYQYTKFKGKQYNALDIKGFNEDDFTKLLELHGADFVVFITWYDIQKEAMNTGEKRSARLPYAGHYLDYDIYNLFQQKVMGEGKIKANAETPDATELSYKLLRVKELEKAYDNFVTYIIERLNQPIE
jgi:hypothetical protein